MFLLLYYLTKMLSVFVVLVPSAPCNGEDSFQRSFHCALMAAGSSIEMVENIVCGKVCAFFYLRDCAFRVCTKLTVIIVRFVQHCYYLLTNLKTCLSSL